MGLFRAKDRRGDERGQAIIEYLLTLTIAVTAIGLMVRGFRTTIVKTWKAWNQEISAACPTCKPPGDVQ